MKLFMMSGAEARARTIIDRAISEQVREKKRRLRRSWVRGSNGDAAVLNAMKGVRSKSRQYAKRMRKSSFPGLKSKTRDGDIDYLVKIIRGKKPSQYLDSIYPNRNKEWKYAKNRRPSKRPSSINLRNFSFNDDPNETLKSLKKIAIHEATSFHSEINFEDEYCLDVVPFMLLAEFWHEMLPVFRGGTMPVPVQKVLAEVGLKDELGITLIGLTEASDVWAFPIQRRRKAGATTSKTRYLDVPTRDLLVDQFCDAIDHWISEVEENTALSKKGRASINNIFGEILENAERHSDGSRGDGSWSMAGVMVRRETEEKSSDDNYEYKCYLGFVNIGDTFSESLNRANSRISGYLSRYIKSCRDKGCRTSEDTLKTLCAVQDTVTCDSNADENQRGGSGLQEMLYLTNLLGRHSEKKYQPKITIVSGRSCIQFKTPYLEGTRAAEGLPRELWFNSSNSKQEPPDSEFVFDLEEKLPGTIVSISFNFDSEYLKNGRNNAGS